MPTVRRKVPAHLDTPYQEKKTEPPKTCNARNNSRRISPLRLIIGFGLLAPLFLLRGRSRLVNAPYAICSFDSPAIYTVDAENSIVECIVVNGSTILDSGRYDDMMVRWTTRTSGIESILSTRTSLKTLRIPPGAIMIPGMTDSHCHTLEYGASRILPLEGLNSVHAVVEHVRNYAISNPVIFNDKTAFIEGWGWDHTLWPVGQELLESDHVLRGRPIILQSKDGHAIWVSEKILSGMIPLPKYVDGGIIEKDIDGIPRGVFLDKAQELVKRPPLTYEDKLLRFNLTASDALSRGLTSLHDAGFDPATLEFYDKKSQSDVLPVRYFYAKDYNKAIESDISQQLRVYGMAHFNETAEYWGDTRAKIIDRGRLTARSVKIFADGALRSGGAALFEPYADNADSKGFMRIDPAILFEFIPKFIRDGWQVNIHAIGDLANSIVLDALESTLANYTGDTKNVRLRIEHAQIIRPKDAVRLAHLGVIASIQPTHVISDMWFAEDRLGPERVKNLYAFRTIIDAGARVTLGSDFPVEDMNPLASFHAAVTRFSPDGQSPHGSGGWFPNQKLTRNEALRGITIDPAYASFSESKLGSLEPGKLADFVVLSQDIMTTPENLIRKTRVLATAIDGTIVYGQL